MREMLSVLICGHTAPCGGSDVSANNNEHPRYGILLAGAKKL